jgi:hypothetical protein
MICGDTNAKAFAIRGRQKLTGYCEDKRPSLAVCKAGPFVLSRFWSGGYVVDRCGAELGIVVRADSEALCCISRHGDRR